jgi:hypothetical protein
MAKRCTQCKEDKSDAEFIKHGTQRHSMCDPCRKAYQNARYHDRQKRKQ